MRELYCFQKDLRLSDNSALNAHAQGDALLLVYFWQIMPGWCNLRGLGAQRERFLLESLQSLRSELQAQGQNLLVLNGSPVEGIPKLAALYAIDRVGMRLEPGSYEASQRRELKQSLSIPLVVHNGSSLFELEQLPGSLETLPQQFTPFRNKVEKLEVQPTTAAFEQLPPPPRDIDFPPLRKAAVSAHPAFPLRGGTAAGMSRLHNWMFEREHVIQYKETRNYLEGINNSSLLSPWLANGNVSPRQVAHSLFQFEQQVCRNESTSWLYQELLWREFFHWRAMVDDRRLFIATGISGKKHLRSFEARDFARWCQGDTDEPLINALMHQLVTTGWMSNRGRQLVASYLINELNHDWRYGAAFFEKHLIDFEVGSNYGNWQYIAGVGTDPRGGRHFNVQKQTESYDPEGIFTSKWGGHQLKQPRYINDAADWPVDAGDY